MPEYGNRSDAEGGYGCASYSALSATAVLSASIKATPGRTFNAIGLSPGLWQFRVYALQGARVSDPSNTVTKRIP